MNLRLDIAYDGTRFRGFARQPDVVTVQGELESALHRILGQPVDTSVAGRTDAGVHALGQVVGLEVPTVTEPERLRSSLNALCGPDISVHRAVRAPEGWHPRFSARSRIYVYALLLSELHDPFLARTTWRRGSPLEVEAMNEAAGHLLGEHDFSAFGRVPEPGASAVRVLYELRCMRRGNLIRIRARANAFIQQMVRSLVGTLVEVGEGRLSPDDMPGILASKDRARAGRVAPPEGLCLVSVEYEDGWSRPPADGFPAG